MSQQLAIGNAQLSKKEYVRNDEIWSTVQCVIMDGKELSFVQCINCKAFLAHEAKNG